MPKVTRVIDRKWEDQAFDPRGEKVELFNARPTREGRTLLSRYPPKMQTKPARSDSHWDIFVLEGDIAINGEKLGPGDHVLIFPGEEISYFTDKGCEFLIFIRTDHEWVS